MLRRNRDTEEKERWTKEEKERWTKEVKGIHELNRGIRKTGMSQEERDQEMDKHILYQWWGIC